VSSKDGKWTSPPWWVSAWHDTPDVCVCATDEETGKEVTVLKWIDPLVAEAIVTAINAWYDVHGKFTPSAEALEATLELTNRFGLLLPDAGGAREGE
jgi:hypothetical protein